MTTKAVRKHYVSFLSPGSFFSETTDREIDSWDVKKVIEMAKSIKERYGATPYGFYFKTFITHPPIPDGEGGTLNVQPKQVADSPYYFLGGEIKSYDDVVSRNDPEDKTLISNMRSNNYPFIIVNTNSYRSTLPFGEKDILLDKDTGEVLRRGDDPGMMTYRKEAKAKFDSYYENLFKKDK